MRFSFEPPGRRPMTVSPFSPDGTRLVYSIFVGHTVQRAPSAIASSELDSKPIEGTEYGSRSLLLARWQLDSIRHTSQKLQKGSGQRRTRRSPICRYAPSMLEGALGRRRHDRARAARARPGHRLGRRRHPLQPLDHARQGEERDRSSRPILCCPGARPALYDPRRAGDVPRCRFGHPAGEERHPARRRLLRALRVDRPPRSTARPDGLYAAPFDLASLQIDRSFGARRRGGVRRNLSTALSNSPSPRMGRWPTNRHSPHQ